MKGKDGGFGFGMNYKRKLLVSGYFEEVVSFLFSPDAYIYILKIIEKDFSLIYIAAVTQSSIFLQFCLS